MDSSKQSTLIRERREALGLSQSRLARFSGLSRRMLAGLEAGDQILRIDGTEVRSLDALWKRLWAGGAPEREVTLEIERNSQAQTLKVYSVDRMKTLKRAEGI